MNYLKKTAIFALMSGLMIGTTQTNMDDDIENWLTNHNWHRTTIWGTKMRTQDIPYTFASIFLMGSGVAFLRLPFTRDYSIVRNMGKNFNSPLADALMGCVSLGLGAAVLALIYQHTQAIQTEN